MKVLVYNIAASEGGALTILNQIYDYAVNNKDIEWKFIISTPKLNNTHNVIIENYPKTKKNWLVRLNFDKFEIKKIIKNYKPDYVLNLQNIAVNTKVKQVVYMHQSLPFTDYKFAMSDKKMWIYQNIIGRMIKKSLHKANKIIVQTNWIKNAIVKQCKINPDLIEIHMPKADVGTFNYNEQLPKKYFYPASAIKYKNHQIIVNALIELKKQNILRNVIFTFKGNENALAESLFNQCKSNELNVEFLGYLSHDEVLKIQSTSTLIFASYIETLGLPLLEAKLMRTPIIASNTEFAQEILQGYENIKFFDSFDCNTLVEIMKTE